MIDTASIEIAARILQERAHGAITRGGPIGPLTSYRLGGPAGVLLEAASVADLEALSAAVAASAAPVLIVGRGSNMLVSDDGFPGIAVRLGGGFRWARVEDTHVLAGAAMPLPSLATLAMHDSLRGIEFAVAIPASLGGAVRMNAGAHGHEIGDVVESVDVFSLAAGHERTIKSADAGFVYRDSALPPDSIVTRATLALAPGDPEAIVEAMNEAKEWRRTTQPLNMPNGGSVFKNPPGDYAARVVETVCGKGMAQGGARISEVHANFIVASPGATARDVYRLMRRIQRMVREQTGIELQPELKLIGRFEDGHPDEDHHEDEHRDGHRSQEDTHGNA